MPRSLYIIILIPSDFRPHSQSLEIRRHVKSVSPQIQRCGSWNLFRKHFVTEGVDEGPIILQAAVPILDEDRPETLAARILEQEHKIYPRAVELFAEGAPAS
jgi:hypothetical protein